MHLHDHRWLVGCASVPLDDGGATAAGVWEVTRRRNLAPPAWRVDPPTPWPTTTPALTDRKVTMPPLLAATCGSVPGCADRPPRPGLRRRRLPRAARPRPGRPAVHASLPRRLTGVMEAALWRPASPCGTACLPRPGAVPRALPTTVAGRVVAAAAVLLFAAVVLPLLPASRCAGTARRVARALLAALGVRHRVTGRLVTRARARGGQPRVVARRGGAVRRTCRPGHWPRPRCGCGRWWAASPSRWARCSSTGAGPARCRRRSTRWPARCAAAARWWRSRRAPPGAAGPADRSRPALFQAALAAGAVVAPVRLTFALADGSPTTVAAFVGDESLLTSLRRVLTARGLAVTLRAHPPIHPGLGATRRGARRRHPDRAPVGTHAEST